MNRDYRIASPSLEGVLSHDSVEYEGLRRPVTVMRVFDGPAADPSGKGQKSGDDRRVIEQYFHDLCGIFMKNISRFLVEPDPSPDESVKLQAMFQEIVKVKGVMRRF